MLVQFREWVGRKLAPRSIAAINVELADRTQALIDCEMELAASRQAVAAEEAESDKYARLWHDANDAIRSLFRMLPSQQQVGLIASEPRAHVAAAYEEALRPPAAQPKYVRQFATEDEAKQ